MDGLYHMRIEPLDGGRATNAGVMVMRDGQILGGDAFFYYVGAYTAAGEGWRGELVTRQHTRSGDFRPAFGALDVTVSLTGQPGGNGLECTAHVRQDVPASYKVNLQKIADA